MRVIHGCVGVALVAVLVLACGSLAVPAAVSAATPSAAQPAAQSRLGSVTALAWRVKTPVRARLVFRPHLSFKLRKRTLRTLRARKPRLSGSFTARIVTRPLRGRGRTVAVVSRRARGVALRTSAAHSILGKSLRLKRWLFSRRQTAAVKRAAKRHRLALTISARYRASYTDARGRRTVTRMSPRSVTLPLAVRRQRARGGDLRELAVTFRRLLSRVGKLKTACVTRNTILRQLRNTYSTMVSGDRSGAAGLLKLYIDDAGVMGAAGLLGREQASMLSSEMGTILRRVGSGQSKRVERARRWRSLPACGPTRARSAQTLIAIIVRRVAKRVRKALVKTVRRVHKAKDRAEDIRDVVDALWPEDETEESVEDTLPAGDPTNAQATLEALQGQFDTYSAWADCCLATSPANLSSAWGNLVDNLRFNRWRFQPSSSYYSLDDQLALLPLFAEYMNMYLTVLHEGIVYGPRWGLLPETTLSLEDEIRAELDPNKPSSGCMNPCAGGNAMSYSKSVYDRGLARLGSSTDFAKTNEFKREMQIGVRDISDMWYLQDAMRYPYGDPSFKQDRIIYSDAVGTTTQALSPPPNPASPLSALTAWTTRVSHGPRTNQNWLTAIRTDNTSLGARTGAAGGTPSSYTAAPGSPPPPWTIVQIDATTDREHSGSQTLISALKLHFGDGTTAVPGGDVSTEFGDTTSLTFEGEVLAAAKIMGSYTMSNGTAVADSAVFGFRQADSFSSQWKGSLPGKLSAPNTQSCVAVEQVPITSGAHSGTTTGSRANGAAMQMRPCSTAWEQTWQYEDYNDPNIPDDDTAQRDLNVYAGTMCAAPEDGGVTAGTPVRVYYCDGTLAQNWTRNPDGSITHDQSNLCLERAGGAVSSGTPIQLSTCNGSDAQKWTWPR